MNALNEKKKKNNDNNTTEELIAPPNRTRDRMKKKEKKRTNQPSFNVFVVWNLRQNWNEPKEKKNDDNNNKKNNEKKNNETTSKRFIFQNSITRKWLFNRQPWIRSEKTSSSLSDCWRQWNWIFSFFYVHNQLTHTQQHRKMWPNRKWKNHLKTCKNTVAYAMHFFLLLFSFCFIFFMLIICCCLSVVFFFSFCFSFWFGMLRWFPFKLCCSHWNAFQWTNCVYASKIQLKTLFAIRRKRKIKSL